MVAVRVSPFGGMVPAVDDRLLSDVNGALSQDTWTYSGTARGIALPKLLKSLQSTTSKVYRLPRNYTDSLHLNDSIWMEFANADTDVLRTQVVDDTFDRYYWMSPATAPRYAPYSMIQSQVPNVVGYLLGVPSPLGNLADTVTGGSSSTLYSCAYLQTFVSAYGEEGPPSNPLLIASMKIDATVNLTLLAPDPGDTGTNRNLTRSRIYRTITASNGTATYYLVADVAIGTTTYSDNHATLTDAILAFNSQLESTTWSQPPSDLQGMVSLSNGMVVAFRQNELWFCEPYRMHAWPAGYVLVTEYPIVGLGVSQQMLIVATEGFAYTATGITPSSMNLVKLPGLTPCTSRGSIVSSTEGVYFSTPAGLINISTAGIALATKELIRKDSWEALVATNSLRAAKLGDGYYAFGQAIFGVFDTASFDTSSFAQQDFSGARRGILIDPTSLSVAFNLMSSQDPVTNIQVDAWSSEVFIIRDSQLYWLDIGDEAQARSVYTWRTKIYQMTEKKNFQAMKVYFNASPAWPVQYVQDPQIPTMVAAVTSGVTIQGDTADVTNKEAWRATLPGGAWVPTTGMGHYITVDFGAAGAFAASSYVVGGPASPVSPNEFPTAWTFAGSNDGVNFTTLDTRTAQALSSSIVNEYTITNQIAYRYYRLTVTAVVSGTQIALAAFQVNQPKLGICRIYADGQLVFKRDLRVSGEQWRLPSGFRADYWQWEFEAGVEIYSMQAATSPTELKTV